MGSSGGHRQPALSEGWARCPFLSLWHFRPADSGWPCVQRGRSRGGRCRSNLGRPPEASLLCPLPLEHRGLPRGCDGSHRTGAGSSVTLPEALCVGPRKALLSCVCVVYGGVRRTRRSAGLGEFHLCALPPARRTDHSCATWDLPSPSPLLSASTCPSHLCPARAPSCPQDDVQTDHPSPGGFPKDLP